MPRCIIAPSKIPVKARTGFVIKTQQTIQKSDPIPDRNPESAAFSDKKAPSDLANIYRFAKYNTAMKQFQAV